MFVITAPSVPGLFLQAHVTFVSTYDVCLPLQALEGYNPDFDSKVLQLGGFDMKGVSCDLWEFAPANVKQAAGTATSWMVIEDCFCLFLFCKFHFLTPVSMSALEQRAMV